MTSLWRHVSINLNKIFYFCLFYQQATLWQIWAKSDKKQRSCKNGKWRHCVVISKNSWAIFCGWVFFTHTYWCSKFQVDWRSDKGITGGGTKHPPQAENDQKSQGRIGLNTTSQLYHDLQSFATEFHEITNISIPRNLTAPTLSTGWSCDGRPFTF